MSTFLERMQVEIAELDEKIAKLGAFLTSETFGALTAIERHLLEAQFSSMITYLNILTIRFQIASSKANVEEDSKNIN